MWGVRGSGRGPGIGGRAQAPPSSPGLGMAHSKAPAASLSSCPGHLARGSVAAGPRGRQRLEGRGHTEEEGQRAGFCTQGPGFPPEAFASRTAWLSSGLEANRVVGMPLPDWLGGTEGTCPGGLCILGWHGAG